MAGMVLVRDVMTKNPKVVRRDTSVQEVVATMNKFDISSVIVVQEERPVGIITHKDIMSKIVQPHSTGRGNCSRSHVNSRSYN